jgi:NAD-dependent dihydropyrimidine dehydrogenase PreA subunit
MNEVVKRERTKPRGTVEIRVDECKGCSYCVEECPYKVLVISQSINRMGYHPSQYLGDGCTGCGICFYACPEPGAILVRKLASA